MRFRVTRAKPIDIELLVEHRLNMWREIRPEFRKKIDRSASYTQDWIRRKLSSGELVGFIAKTADGKAAGSGCVWLREEPPRPANPLHVVPYLMSMYTVKEFRRKGVAKAVLRQAVRWSRAHHHERIVLHASDDGRHLYEEFGFAPGREMRLMLNLQ
ncbi:MAG: GNAT family N-acetyltransferase [Nitrososphaerota archaeon]|nr:GNAT family N-acetyltransferase [Nitrososphaerota archaeon]